MDSFLGLENIAQVKPSLTSRLHRGPTLLLELEPWGRCFRRNLADLLLGRRPPAVTITSAPAPFWPDVFVASRLPWSAFAESILYHSVVLALAWGLSGLFAQKPQITRARAFDPSDVIYYSPSEYLPPLDTGTAQASRQLKGQPTFARQPILSVPPESDNRHQTIVTPPDIRLTQDIATPNIVAWGNRSVPVPLAATERKSSPLPPLPNQIVAPAPEVYESATRNLGSLSQPVVVAPPPNADSGEVRAVATLAIDVVAPAPDATNTAGRPRSLSSPAAAIVEPPPAINAAEVRRLGDINFARSEIIAPAPQLAVPVQRALPTLGGAAKAVVPPPPSVDANTAARNGTGHRIRAGLPPSEVIPPPPSVQGARSSEAGGRLIALGIHPAAALPPNLPEGNRRGTFAAGPEGKPGAPGTPDMRPSNPTADHGLAATNGAGNLSGAPPGLHVGAPAHNAATAGDPAAGSGMGSGNPRGQIPLAHDSARVIASASPGPTPKGVEVVENPSPMELKVFGTRRLYSMTLNMPNLNSAGGSWVIRFAELDESNAGELIAPVAEHKVDPAYPMELMEQNVAGTVTLRAIIRADGTVGDIRVVSGPDQRLDRYAADALSRWHFHPAVKNGSTINVEAIVIIPFRPILRKPF
jgi:TonB family protein